MAFRIILLLILYTSLVRTLPEIHTEAGSLDKPLTITVNKSNEYIIYYSTFHSRNPYRIKVTSEKADPNNPILVVVRTEKDVLSWEVPLMIETSKNQKMFYNVTSRTMCHQSMQEINKLSFGKLMGMRFNQLGFAIGISSSCPVPTEVLIETIEEDHFFITDGKNTSLTVSPSQSRYVFYRFSDKDSDTLTVEIDSGDDVCLVVSIQDSYCPVFDIYRNIKFSGKYQTILRKGGLTIRRKDYSDGFFLVFVALPDNYECTEEKSLISTINKLYSERQTDVMSNVSFIVRGSFNKKQYVAATLTTMGAIILFYVLTAVLIIYFEKYGTLKHIRKNLDIDEDVADQTFPRSSMDILYVLEKEDLNVKTLARYPTKIKKRSFNYLWHIISIAIFYSIPVVQLVIGYQRMVNATGDEDLCYFNFLCAHPLFGFNDFNHIFSNVGYLFMGILFLLTTLHRQSLLPFRFEIGIPVHYGLYYAMGVALIIEGILSACYHICPSQSNYQFDTSFMYVMAVLCMIKLYQNRHSDLNATAYSTFSVLGIGIFIGTLGILNGSLTIWLIFIVGYTILCFYISFKIYFLSFVIEGFVKFKNELLKNGFKLECLIPVKKARFCVLLAANVFNIGMLVVGLVLFSHGSTDFGTFLLGLLMGNAVLHLIFYVSMKLIHHERICPEAILYCSLGILSWTVATIFFLDPATLWTVTPAESRQWNQECVLMDYYDKHDVWHLLSAPALYFTFMFLMCMDDDIIDKRQEDIPVF